MENTNRRIDECAGIQFNSKQKSIHDFHFPHDMAQEHVASSIHHPAEDGYQKTQIENDIKKTKFTIFTPINQPKPTKDNIVQCAANHDPPLAHC